MKKKLALFIFSIFSVNTLIAQITVSGILDTTVSGNAGAGNMPAYSFGFEEYANIRFQARLREIASIYGAVNLIAASGDSALGLAGTGASITDNFIAAIELERLYFRMRGEHIDFDGGLFRLPFGYGQVWGPSDFLNPRNPLKPDARLRGILGAALTWHLVNELKLLGFYAAPRDALANEGSGSLFGISLEKRQWGIASIQGLYSFETSITGLDFEESYQGRSSAYGIHRAGLSLKLDITAGLVMEALYIYNHEERTKLDGLSASAGIDYSFLDGNIIAAAEYLYNGNTSATALGYGGNFSNTHYLYTGLTFRFNDFTNLSAALLSCFDDISFTPILTLNHELFQGATLIITAQVPLDRDLFHKDGNQGELGPRASYFNCSARVRLRF